MALRRRTTMRAPRRKTRPRRVLAKLGACTKVSTSPYATDDGDTPKIDICGLKNAVWWKADLDVDCDGKTSAECNEQTDPAYQDQTAATDSKDDPLDAASLPTSSCLNRARDGTIRSPASRSALSSP